MAFINFPVCYDSCLLCWYIQFLSNRFTVSSFVPNLASWLFAGNFCYIAYMGLCQSLFLWYNGSINFISTNILVFVAYVFALYLPSCVIDLFSALVFLIHFLPYATFLGCHVLRGIKFPLEVECLSSSPFATCSPFRILSALLSHIVTLHLSLLRHVSP